MAVENQFFINIEDFAKYEEFLHQRYVAGGTCQGKTAGG